MTALLRCTALIAAILLAPCTPSFGDVPATTIGAGEIQLNGIITDVDPIGAQFELQVHQVQGPHGAATVLSPPRNKNVKSSATIAAMSNGVAILDPLAVLHHGDTILAIGPNTGTGQPLPARLIVILKRAATAAPPAAPAVPAPTTTGASASPRSGDVNARDERDQTALMRAAAAGDLTTVNSLISAGADVNAASMDAQLHGTALTLAVGAGRVDCVKALITAGANVNMAVHRAPTDWSHAGPVIMRNGWTATMIAASAGNANMTNILIAAGADVNKKGADDGWTSLMGAANSGSAECINALIAAHADINATDQSGETALMAAASKGNLDCAKALIAAGADVNLKKADGKTALAVASSDEVVAALRKAGAQGTADFLEVGLKSIMPVFGAPVHSAMSGDELASNFSPPEVISRPLMEKTISVEGTQTNPTVRFTYALPNGWQIKHKVDVGYAVVNTAVVGPHGVMATAAVMTVKGYITSFFPGQLNGRYLFDHDCVVGDWVAGAYGKTGYSNWRGFEGPGSYGTIWTLNFIKPGSPYVIQLSVFDPQNNPDGRTEAVTFIGAAMSTINVSPQ